MPSFDECNRIADELATQVENGSAPSWLQNQLDWYRQGQISCTEMINSAGWLASSVTEKSAITDPGNTDPLIDGGSLDSLIHEILQDRNLVDLGKSQVDASKAINDQIAIREQQRQEDLESETASRLAQQEFNQIIADNQTAIGSAIQNNANEISALDARSGFNDVITGLLGGSSLTIVLAMVALMFIMGKRK